MSPSTQDLGGGRPTPGDAASLMAAEGVCDTAPASVTWMRATGGMDAHPPFSRVKKEKRNIINAMFAHLPPVASMLPRKFLVSCQAVSVDHGFKPSNRWAATFNVASSTAFSSPLAALARCVPRMLSISSSISESSASEFAFLIRPPGHKANPGALAELRAVRSQETSTQPQERTRGPQDHWRQIDPVAVFIHEALLSAVVEGRRSRVQRNVGSCVGAGGRNLRKNWLFGQKISTIDGANDNASLISAIPTAPASPPCREND